ncbi:uncharacterized protein VTP21DRAFT_1303 [Calcarisporiella thermophila]|uniref:uncharacterized protein n=1 Tax=Calcarisporiella thermophila TaxID=911321 RepID=UPI0037445147
MYPGNQYKQQYGNQPPPHPPQQGYGYPPQQYYPPPPGPPPQNYGPPPSFPMGMPQSSNAPQQHGQYYPPPPGPPPPISAGQNTSIYPPSTPNAGDGIVAHANPNHGLPSNFQLSNCTGVKRALLIGINYFGQKGELRGCINDVRNMKQFLLSRGWREGDMVTLTDDQRDPKFIPTKANIIAAMQWLVRNAQPNDSYFFHYSGHGGQARDLDGDEEDGMDETIYPLDHTSAGMLTDDEMHYYLVKPLPAGCRLTALFDSCHSGSALDLPYMYSTQGTLKDTTIAATAGTSLLSMGTDYLRGDIGGLLKTATSLGNTLLRGNKSKEISRQTRSSPADAIMFSGCKDMQTSADTTEGGQNTGAMSYAFTTVMRSGQQFTYRELLVAMRQILAAKYSQKPQLSSSHPMDMNTVFIL